MDTGLTSGNVQNQPSEQRINTRSNFNLSYHNFLTERFADITPHFVFDTVADDKNVRFQSKHDIRAYTLEAPLMGDIQCKKDYFVVPMECILPNTWPLIFTNPTIGDDVPSDAICAVPTSTLFDSLRTYLQSKVDVFTSSENTGIVRLQNLFRFMLFSELWFSRGSLLDVLGIKLSTMFNVVYDSVYMSIDKFIDVFFQKISVLDGTLFQLKISTDEIYNVFGKLPNTLAPFFQTRAISLRYALELMRDNLGSFEINQVTSSVIDLIPSALTFNVANGGDLYLNFSKPAAYQIVCAHYFSNDHVDYIYSAELYRDLLWSLFYEVASTDGGSGLDANLISFVYNGRQIQYDALSGCIIAYMLDTGLGSAYEKNGLSYFVHLLSFKHSLRFLDYFAGSKTRPLAVGDVNVQVNNNMVNMLDVTQRRWAMKFYNAVQKFGRKFSNYIEGLTGDKPAPDYHNPFWISQTSDSVFTSEIENTGAGQLDAEVQYPITGQLRSNADRFAFSFDADRPGILIGVTYYDIPRSYMNCVERTNFVSDRFDMFNPFMQFLGDQKVYLSELIGRNFDSERVFGYTGRDMQYKQRYNMASGGFVESLKGWIFLNDVIGNPDARFQPIQDHIGPSFIRSKNVELDRFYKSLTGFSLATYFHFIVDNYNECTASRPMAFNPSID